MPMSVSQWLRVRSVLVLVVAIAGRAVLFALPGTEPDRGSRLVAVVDYVTSAAVVIAVLGLGWSTGTAVHGAVAAWYERRLAAGMLGGAPRPSRPWRAVVARSSWTLFIAPAAPGVLASARVAVGVPQVGRLVDPASAREPRTGAGGAGGCGWAEVGKRGEQMWCGEVRLVGVGSPAVRRKRGSGPR